MSLMFLVVQMYLPPYSGMNKDFLKQILSDEKQVLLTKDVNQIKVPLYEELNVVKLWSMYRSDDRLKHFLPDRVAKGRQIDRSWFMNVFNTLAHETLAQIVDHAEKQRT